MPRPNKLEVKEAIKQLKSFGFTDEDLASRLKVTSVAVRNWRVAKSAPNWPSYDMLLVMLQKLKKGKKK